MEDNLTNKFQIEGDTKLLKALERRLSNIKTTSGVVLVGNILKLHTSLTHEAISQWLYRGGSHLKHGKKTVFLYTPDQAREPQPEGVRKQQKGRAAKDAEGLEQIVQMMKNYKRLVASQIRLIAELLKATNNRERGIAEDKLQRLFSCRDWVEHCNKSAENRPSSRVSRLIYQDCMKKTNLGRLNE